MVCAVADPPLTDGVVSLRPWTFDDAPEMVASLDGDQEIARWLDLVPQPYSEEDARAYISGEVVPGETAFAIVDAGDDRVLGSIGIHWSSARDIGEIGYWVRSDARGRGVVTRALVLLSRHALLEDGASRVQLQADPDNVPSCRAAERAGFRREGVLRSVHWNERLGRRQDHALYSLLPADLT
jgi:RimJ/RimL family protein N-acetyltransferase